MCRLSALITSGEPVYLADIITRPKMSIIHQSYNCKERMLHLDPRDAHEQSTLNGDGFGVGWYTDRDAGGSQDDKKKLEPCVFTSLKPAWSDRNLHIIADKTKSNLIFAHVRAAAPGSGLSTELNCHPFRYGRFLFMHNGFIADFERIRRRLLSEMNDVAFNYSVSNSCIDTVILFSLFINQLYKGPYGDYTAEELKKMLENVLHYVAQVCNQEGVQSLSLLNIVLTDGSYIIATRYSLTSMQTINKGIMPDDHSTISAEKGDERTSLIDNEYSSTSSSGLDTYELANDDEVRTIALGGLSTTLQGEQEETIIDETTISASLYISTGTKWKINVCTCSPPKQNEGNSYCYICNAAVVPNSIAGVCQNKNLNYLYDYRMKHTDRRADVCIITSEPLTEYQEDWLSVPLNSMVIITPLIDVLYFPITNPQKGTVGEDKLCIDEKAMVGGGVFFPLYKAMSPDYATLFSLPMLNTSMKFNFCATLTDRVSGILKRPKSTFLNYSPSKIIPSDVSSHSRTYSLENSSVIVPRNSLGKFLNFYSRFASNTCDVIVGDIDLVTGERKEISNGKGLCEPHSMQPERVRSSTIDDDGYSYEKTNIHNIFEALEKRHKSPKKKIYTSITNNFIKHQLGDASASILCSQLVLPHRYVMMDDYQNKKRRFQKKMELRERAREKKLFDAEIGDTGYLICGSQDGIIKIWNLQTYDTEYQFKSHYNNSSVLSLAIYDEEESMVTARCGGGSNQKLNKRMLSQIRISGPRKDDCSNSLKSKTCDDLNRDEVSDGMDSVKIVKDRKTTGRSKHVFSPLRSQKDKEKEKEREKEKDKAKKKKKNKESKEKIPKLILFTGGADNSISVWDISCLRQRSNGVTTAGPLFDSQKIASERRIEHGRYEWPDGNRQEDSRVGGRMDSSFREYLASDLASPTESLGKTEPVLMLRIQLIPQQGDIVSLSINNFHYQSTMLMVSTQSTKLIMIPVNDILMMHTACQKVSSRSYPSPPTNYMISGESRPRNLTPTATTVGVACTNNKHTTDVQMKNPYQYSVFSRKATGEMADSPLHASVPHTAVLIISNNVMSDSIQMRRMALTKDKSHAICDQAKGRPSVGTIHSIVGSVANDPNQGRDKESCSKDAFVGSKDILSAQIRVPTTVALIVTANYQEYMLHTTTTNRCFSKNDYGIDDEWNSKKNNEMKMLFSPARLSLYDDGANPSASVLEQYDAVSRSFHENDENESTILKRREEETDHSYYHPSSHSVPHSNFHLYSKCVKRNGVPPKEEAEKQVDINFQFFSRTMNARINVAGVSYDIRDGNLISNCLKLRVRCYVLPIFEDCERHFACIETICVANRKFGFIGSGDGIIHVWNPTFTKHVSSLKGHVGAILTLATHVNQEGHQILFSGSRDKSVRIWDVTSKMCTSVLKEFSGEVMCVKVHQNYLAASTSNGEIAIWSLCNLSLVHSLFIETECNNPTSVLSFDMLTIRDSLEGVYKHFLYACCGDGISRVLKFDETKINNQIADTLNKTFNHSRTLSQHMKDAALGMSIAKYPDATYSTQSPTNSRHGRSLSDYNHDGKMTPLQIERRAGTSLHEGTDTRSPETNTVANHLCSLETDLARLITFKTISSNPKYLEEHWSCARFFSCLFNRLGANVKLYRSHLGTSNCPPVIVAKLQVDDSLPTVLFYGHYDVVDVDDVSRWNSSPFQLSGRNGYFYGRGVSDNKGPVLATIYAVKSLLQLHNISSNEVLRKKESGSTSDTDDVVSSSNSSIEDSLHDMFNEEMDESQKQSLPCNVIWLIEGEEEIGSPNLPSLMKELNQKGVINNVSSIVCCNSTWIGDNSPCLVYGMRGILDIKVTVKGGEGDLHSGIHGGAVCEPLQDLFVVLATLTDISGDVCIPGFYNDVCPSTPEEEERVRAIAEKFCTFKQYKDICGNANIRCNKPYEILSKRWLEPSLSITNISTHQCEVKCNSNRVIPSHTSCTISIRLVNGQKPLDIFEKVKTHIEHEYRKRRSRNTMNIEMLCGGAAWQEDPTSHLYRVASSAVYETWGMKALLVREGGSIPIIEFLQSYFAAPVLQLPLGQASDGCHVVNERIRITNLQNGVEVLRRILQKIGQGKK